MRDGIESGAKLWFDDTEEFVRQGFRGAFDVDGLIGRSAASDTNGCRSRVRSFVSGPQGADRSGDDPVEHRECSGTGDAEPAVEDLLPVAAGAVLPSPVPPPAGDRDQQQSSPHSCHR